MSSTQHNLQGKVALVTGGGRGIGKAISHRLAADGAFVLVNYSVGKEPAEKTVAEIEAGGGRAAVVQGDVGLLASIRKLYLTTDELLTKRFGAPRIDIIVNNAAISFLHTVDTIGEAGYDRIFAVNVKGPFFMAQQVLSRMPDGGRIINISSINAHRELARIGPIYSTSKHAVTGLTINLAAALGSRRITVNAVESGPVPTDMVREAAGVTPESSAAVSAMTALGRWGQPEEIADTVAFFASNDARWVTGQCLGVNGGFLL